MAFLRCEIAAESLRMATAVDVILPDKGDLHDAKTLYLLHGLTDDCTGWTRYTAVERYARERGMAVVLPEVQRSFYTDMVYGLPYFTYVSEELPAVCRRMFGLAAAREQNYIFGLSMGGYGAMKCALTYPERYAGAASFSGVSDLRRTIERRSLSLREAELTAISAEGRSFRPGGTALRGCPRSLSLLRRAGRAVRGERALFRASCVARHCAPVRALAGRAQLGFLGCVAARGARILL